MRTFLKPLHRLTVICLCLSLYFVQLTPQFDFSDRGAISSYKVGISSAMGSTDVPSLMKINKSSFKGQFLPLIVMLGIAFMGVFLIKNSLDFSPDMIIFAVGAMTYLVSVLISLKSEVRNFEFDPKELGENPQVEALRKQKEGLKDTRDVAENRLKFLAAATAAFASAAVTAGVLYLKGKAARKKMKAGLARTSGEFQQACQRSPQVAARSQVDPSAMPRCLKNQNMATMQLNETRQGFQQCTQADEKARREEGSNQASIQDLLTCAPVLGQWGSMGIVVDKGPQTSSMLRDEADLKRFVEAESLKIEKDLDENLGKLFNEAFSQVISTAHAQVESLPKAPVSQLPNNDPLAGINEVTSIYSSFEAPGQVVFDTGLGGELAAKAEKLIEGISEKIIAKVKEKVNQKYGRETARRIFKSPGWKRVSLKVRRFAARRVTIAIASTGASAVGGPLAVGGVALVNGVSLAFGAYSLYDDVAPYVAALADGEITEEEANALMKKSAENVAKRGFKGGFPKKTVEVDRFAPFDFFMPKAHAFAPAFPAKALQTMIKVKNEGQKEVDKWLSRPKGRMVVFGAIGALVGYITYDTNEHIKKIDKNIDIMDEMIEGFNENDVQTSSVESRDEKKDGMTYWKAFLAKAIENFVIPKVMAQTNGGSNELVVAMPCLVPQRGRCLSLKSKYENMTNKLGIHSDLPSTIRKSNSAVLNLGDLVQTRNQVGSKAMSYIDYLSENAEMIVKTQAGFENGLNRSLNAQGQAGIAFASMRSSMLEKFQFDAEKVLVASNMKGRELLSLYNTPTQKINKGKQERQRYFDEGFKMDFTEETDDVGPYIKDDLALGAKPKTRSDEDAQMKRLVESLDYEVRGGEIHKSKDIDLFKIISRRYQIIFQRE